MHFFIDNKGTLTDEKALPGKWLSIVRRMKENGHSVSVLTSGSYGKYDEKQSGVDRHEFDDVHEQKSKGSKADFSALAKSLKLDPETCSLIDDDMINVFMANKAGWENSIPYTSIDELEKELIHRSYILA